jgi:5-methyltetrahydrofolate--homocysteine methyltransferase
MPGMPPRPPTRPKETARHDPHRDRSKTKTVTIGFDEPFCVIGERINPSGRKKLNAELEAGDFSTVERTRGTGRLRGDGARCQFGRRVPQQDGTGPALCRQQFRRTAADAELVARVQAVTDVPLCIDSSVTGAIEAALEVVEGRPLINSTTGEEEKMEAILPLCAKHNLPVVAISNDETGISEDPDVRFAVAKKIVERAADHGVPAHDIVVDPLVMPVGAMASAGRQVFALVRRLRNELGVNTTCGASNISFGCRTGTASTRPSCRWRSARA